ncbi:MAG: IS66 family transposase [Gammaproteobacteria bacterium CG_4_10_14_0_8_um_filter_38_16]|nr:MAG: IS66 family transposase [Gammaproteobacteria bacterium CG_4_10_14_0_8_um_filter_38_16]PJA03332.1 MAG: IS66 family transposase [Gammaproteobacteria bacterium CG_4_10_14_0_2_um_filter_38_22]PJB10750.1 MAG: IS66 family transposase [Gammaproteobacteria bacterium CG_4_9_14_3_um_filter_38_9]
MITDIDFMAYVDENTPPATVLKMLFAAQRDKVRSAEEIANLRRKLFGKSSEKRSKAKPEDNAFDEAKASASDLLNDEAVRESCEKFDKSVDTITVEKIKCQARKKGRKPIPPQYFREDFIHDLSAVDKICTCGMEMKNIGEDVTEQLEMVPAKIYVKRHKRQKYACKKCQEGVKIAPVQTQAIAKCMAAPGLLSHVAVMKFDDHLPLYRQSEIWNRVGVDISRNTLSSWVLKMGAILEPLVKHLQKHIVKSGYVMADETTAQVLKTPGKKNKSQSYMWIYLTGNNSKPAVVYDYQETRHGAFAESFLGLFKGVLQTDGYSGYHCVTKEKAVNAMGCWAHARRKFYDTWQLAKTEGVASKAVNIIGQLYDIEREIKDLTSAEKYAIRQKKSKPILEAFHVYLQEIKPHVQPKGMLDTAVGYTLNQWDSLIYYLKDGAVNIDNNAAERQIRPFAIGRKNWLFMGSPEGAKAGAVLYSLIETAKLNDVNPEGYLKFILEHYIDLDDKKLLEKLMPWNAKIPKDYPKPSLKIEENTP